MSFIVKRAFANVAASSTDAALVTAVAGTTIKVLAVVAMAGGTATNITFNSKPSGAGTAISPLFALGINGAVTLTETENGDGWFESNVGEGLTCTTGAGSTVGVLVVYCIRTI